MRVRHGLTAPGLGGPLAALPRPTTASISWKVTTTEATPNWTICTWPYPAGDAAGARLDSAIGLHAGFGKRSRFVSDFAVAAGGHRRRYLPGCFLDDLGSGAWLSMAAQI